MPNKTNITEARARAFMPVGGREAVLWDRAVPGLGLRVRANGHKTWIVHRRGSTAAARPNFATFALLRFRFGLR
ncbi:MAG: hypothetical protein OXC11_00900 [Rhodospirillales bacterium]|nr:hypothetical protein [Rhodospirillales bacterium]